MPIYYFHAVNEKGSSHKLGVGLDDHSAARKHAIVYAGEIMHNEPDVLWDGRDFKVQVSNDRGVMLFIITAYATNTAAGGRVK